MTQERIRQALTSLGLAFQFDKDENTVVNREDLICVFGVFENHFAGLANWRGASTNEEDGYQLRVAINEVNKKVPTLLVHARKFKEKVFAQGIATFPTSYDASDEQLKAMLGQFFSSAQDMAHLLSEYAGHLKTDASEHDGKDS